MKKIVLLLSLLTGSIAFAQTETSSNENVFTLREDRAEDELFHPFFRSVDEMIGKEVQYYGNGYGYDVPDENVYVKKGASSFRHPGRNEPSFSFGQKLKVRGVDTDGEKAYVEFVSLKDGRSAWLDYDYVLKNLGEVYDVSELKRIVGFCDGLVWRKKEYNEKDSYAEEAPMNLPYVKLGYHHVLPVRRFGKLTIAMYYFVGDKDRYEEYDKLQLKTGKFLSEEEMKQMEHKEDDRMIALVKKYGIDVGLVILEKNKWNEDLADRLIDLIGKEEAENIILGKLRIGMSRDLAEISWGEPDSVNKTTYPWGVREQWVYRSRRAYLYFDDGVLSAISEY